MPHASLLRLPRAPPNDARARTQIDTSLSGDELKLEGPQTVNVALSDQVRGVNAAWARQALHPVAARALSDWERHAQKRGWLVTNEDTKHYCAYPAASHADASGRTCAPAVGLAVPLGSGVVLLRHSRASWPDFTPQLRFRNLVSRLNLLEEEYNISYDDLMDRNSTTSVGGAAPAHGPARVVYRLSGTATFHTLFGLRNFPLDSQTFAVEVMSSWGKEHVRLVRNTAQGARSVISRETFSLASEYDLSGQVHLINRESDPKHSSSMTTYSYLEIQMHVRRKLSFWVWNVWLPLFMVTGLSFGAFLVETTQTAARLSITLTILLTLVSYRFSIMSKLPKIDYLTRLDMFFQLCFAVVFAVTVQGAQR